MSRLGIIAGGGALPAALAAADPDALCVAFSGAEIALPETRIQRHRMEHLGALFYALREAGVTRVVLAGAMSRPALDPAALDPVMAALAPRIMAAMQGGDDGLLRLVIAIFEEQGFAVTGAHDLLPDLTAAPGLLTGPEPTDTARADIARILSEKLGESENYRISVTYEEKLDPLANIPFRHHTAKTPANIP